MHVFFYFTGSTLEWRKEGVVFLRVSVCVFGGGGGGPSVI